MAVIATIIDEPGRNIEMLESVVPAMTSDGRSTFKYEYHARRNKGGWLDLTPLGNRIPEDW